MITRPPHISSRSHIQLLLISPLNTALKCNRYVQNIIILLCFIKVLGFLFFHLMLHSFDYNVHVEGLLPANLCLVTLLSLE